MNKYELLLIIKNSISDEDKQAVIDKVEDIVKSNGGSVDSIDKWGTKKFAYTIDYMTEGYYVLWTFSADANVPAEVERFIKISENTVRCMLIRK